MFDCITTDTLCICVLLPLLEYVKSVMETLAFASFHGNSETLHLQGCRTADPCIRKVRYDTVINFSLNFV